MADSMLLPLGEIIAWQCTGTTRPAMFEALRHAGLDVKLARVLAPRDAFSRALKDLDDNRVIRVVSEDKSHILFQFTAEVKIGDEWKYDREATLTLNKGSGSIECSSVAIEAAARMAFDVALDKRTANDVTKIVQAVIESNGDLFAIRPQGGCYFVPQAFAPVIDQVQAFLGQINGTVVRFQVAQGNPETERSVRDSVAAGLAAVMEEHAAAVAQFGKDTRADTIKRAVEKIRNAKFKVEAYSALLRDHREKLEMALKEAAVALRAKVAEIGGKMPAEKGGGGTEPADVPHGVAARSDSDFASAAGLGPAAGGQPSRLHGTHNMR